MNIRRFLLQLQISKYEVVPLQDKLQHLSNCVLIFVIWDENVKIVGNMIYLSTFGSYIEKLCIKTCAVYCMIKTFCFPRRWIVFGYQSILQDRSALFRM